VVLTRTLSRLLRTNWLIVGIRALLTGFSYWLRLLLLPDRLAAGPLTCRFVTLPIRREVISA